MSNEIIGNSYKYIIDDYTQLDNDLAEFNKNPQAAEEDGSSEG